MKTIELKTWTDFEKEVELLKNEFENPNASPIYFRGHADANWRLQPTLLRCLKKDITFREYAQIIKHCYAEIKKYTGNDRGLLPTDFEIDYYHGEFGKSFKNRPEAYIKILEYMVYLRHIGFPSPFLDWTRSPYTAAFFAFRDDLEDKLKLDHGQKNEEKKVAIFAYCEMPLGLKHLNNPQIETIEYDYNFCKRHQLQEAVYTICCKKVNGQYILSDYEFPIQQGEFLSKALLSMQGKGQDYLVKYILPPELRYEVRSILTEKDVNALSLFDTEEALAEKLKTQEFFLKQVFNLSE